MTRNGRAVTLGEEFVRELELAEKYVGRTVPRRGRQLVSEVMDFVLETLAPQPLAYPAFPYPAAPDYHLRRAVFRKQYIIIYEVSEVAVSFVFLHHTSRSGPDLSFLES